MASSRVCSLFRAEPGAKSLFVMSGRGVTCCVPGPAGGPPSTSSSELVLTASSASSQVAVTGAAAI